jgi:hypothetical protein
LKETWIYGKRKRKIGRKIKKRQKGGRKQRKKSAQTHKVEE